MDDGVYEANSESEIGDFVEQDEEIATIETDKVYSSLLALNYDRTKH